MELITLCQDVQNAGVSRGGRGWGCRWEHSVCWGSAALGAEKGWGVPGVSRSAQAANTASLSKTVELNEVGFKFVRKCINAVETKGEELTQPGHASYGLELL